MKTKTLVKTALGTALLCIGSYIAFPLPITQVLFSAQTIVLFIIALRFDIKEALFSVLVYLLMGALGLPVFAGGVGGASKLFGITGGYYLGFLPSAILVCTLRGKSVSFKRYLFVTSVVGNATIYICACLVALFYNGGSIVSALYTHVLPFILPDILKCIIASKISSRA